jgi:SAM-dependent methyltransferase
MHYLRHGDHHRRSTCRGCLRGNLASFLDYGMVPLAGDFLPQEYVGRERLYPMDLAVCLDCSLVQILNVIRAEDLFTDYRYLSSVTATLSRHFQDYAEFLCDTVLSDRAGLVVEIGCNDGVLLRPLKELGIRAVGVDAAENVVEIAKAAGLDVCHSYFGTEVARRLRETHGRAQVVTASNVFAHIDDLDEVLRGVDCLLAEDGTFIVEVHYLLDLLDQFQFDTVYHEHLCYYSVHALSHLFSRYEFEVVDVERLPMHGGAIRVSGRRRSVAVRKPSVESLLELERAAGVTKLETYELFGAAVQKCRQQIRDFVLSRKASGRSICGYGAAGRATILLNFCGLDREVIQYVVDESPSRVGRVFPGVGIPIVSRDHFHEHPTDDCLLTAWNYRDEIIGKEQDYYQTGGCFLAPLPEVEVIQSSSSWKKHAS